MSAGKGWACILESQLQPGPRMCRKRIRIRTSNGAILGPRAPRVGDTIVYVNVYDERPSPGAGLLRYARLKAGLSQSELAERAGVPRTMVSAYEHDRRQATRVAKDRAGVSVALRARNKTKVPG